MLSRGGRIPIAQNENNTRGGIAENKKLRGGKWRVARRRRCFGNKINGEKACKINGEK